MNCKENSLEIIRNDCEWWLVPRMGKQFLGTSAAWLTPSIQMCVITANEEADYLVPHEAFPWEDEDVHIM